MGLGTLINVLLIIAGGLVGLLFSSHISDALQESLLKVCGAAVVFTGIAGTLEEMLVASVDSAGGMTAVTLSTRGTLMMVASLALGTILGEICDIDGRFESLGVWLRDRFAGSGDTRFVDAFVSASLTVSIGAMAIMGAIQDGISGDWSTLALKGSIDCVIICAMSASMGKGCVFAALPVGVFQGLVTLLAHFLQPIMTEAALSNLSLVGNILIFCIGVNLVWPRTFKPANMLPAVVIAVVMAFLPF